MSEEGFSEGSNVEGFRGGWYGGGHRHFGGRYYGAYGYRYPYSYAYPVNYGYGYGGYGGSGCQLVSPYTYCGPYSTKVVSGGASYCCNSF
jgi:hypothetical protein